MVDTVAVLIADPTPALRAGLTGRLLAVLFVLSGISVSVSLLAPLPSDTQRGVLLALNGAEVALGVLAWFAPWTRWHRLCFWLFVPCALGMISVANVAGGFDPYSFAVYFTVVFVWIGMSRPRWTSLLVLPLAVLASHPGHCASPWDRS